MTSRNRGLLLTLAVAYLMVFLQVGLCSADSGSCKNVPCGSGLCCSSSSYCGTGESFCRIGCQSGQCYGNSSGTLGSCLNQSCSDGFCWSAFYFCGKNSSYCGVGWRGGPCNSNSDGTTLNSTGATAGLAFASMLGTITLLGSVFSTTPRRVSISSRSRGWLLIFRLLYIMISLQVGLSTGDLGSCINQACGSGFCCSQSFYCGPGDNYCGLGCRGGACNNAYNVTSGSCVNQACAAGFCCNSNYVCGSSASDCGDGCQGGACYSNSGATALGSVANPGFALASVLGTVTFLVAALSDKPMRVLVCWRKQGWLLTLTLLCLTVSLQVGLSRADNSTVVGACVNKLCPSPDLCCSVSNFCAADSDHCGVGCQSGPCYGKSGGKTLGTGAIVGIAVGSVVGVLMLGTCVSFAARRRGQSSERGQIIANVGPSIDNASDGRLDITGIFSSPWRRFRLDELRSATGGFSEELGKGAFGIVYKGILNGREIAAKKMTASQEVVNDFEAEVKTLGSINHANLVQLLGFTHEVDELYLIYEFVAKKSLDYWIFEKKKSNKDFVLPWDARVTILKGTAKGLAYLHEELQGGKAVVHLDIKPQNILLTECYVPKIADFGLAKLLGSETTKGTVVAAAGTVGYMAPEVFVATVNPKLDVYSFGMVMLVVVAGRDFVDNSLDLDSLFLPSWAIRKCNQGVELEVVDPLLRDCPLDTNLASRFIRIGLLCLQRDPDERPEMSNLLRMMEGFSTTPDLPPNLQSELETIERYFRPRSSNPMPENSKESLRLLGSSSITSAPL